MDAHKRGVAKACLDAAADDMLSFPEIVATLIGEGFESYAVDLRRSMATYYLADGDSVELPAHAVETAIAARFDPSAVQAAIREAQQMVPGYSYRGFCEKIAAAGCAGYLVSFLGRRALYVGRTGETHVELFPD